MKGFAMLKIGQTGWIEKSVPACGPMDAICKPIALAPCTSDIHTVWAGAIGDRKDMILGHEAVGEVVEVGSLVKDFKVGKINVDENPELAGQFGVMSIPTLVVMKNGKIVNRSMGAKPKNAILAML